jgi:hypothetical protein
LLISVIKYAKPDIYHFAKVLLILRFMRAIPKPFLLLVGGRGAPESIEVFKVEP